MPLIGYNAVFYLLGFMTIAALIINRFVSTTFDTYMPFVSDHADVENEIGNAVLTKFVDKVWLHYDTNEDGLLDATETREFVDKILCGKKDRLSNEEFMENFDEFATNGAIQKSSMIPFIRRVSKSVIRGGSDEELSPTP